MTLLNRIGGNFDCTASCSLCYVQALTSCLCSVLSEICVTAGCASTGRPTQQLLFYYIYYLQSIQDSSLYLTNNNNTVTDPIIKYLDRN